MDGKTIWCDDAVIYESSAHDSEDFVPSRRWEAWRDGIEAYEYLVMLRKAADSHVGQNDQAVLDARSFLVNQPANVYDSQDSPTLETQRQQIYTLLFGL